MSFYEVIVQNIGKVFEGSNKFNALQNFNIYVGKSKRSEGRAAGEGVCLYEDGEIIKEHVGHLYVRDVQ